ncbi:MAG: UDP-N-acetylglucosamine 2-epimerase (non-hydrolyzing) [Hyphomicrobiaceae bacterium]|nr:UDP-N-acetylglucosamine 2-epimerase (non-hydrolyzing) [Hyphomicrobiaceae bacterium]
MPITRKILIVIGTRPEAIKLAPVVTALRATPGFDVRVLATSQHRELLDQMLEVFGIKPDLDLDIMQPNQTLSALTSRLLVRLDEVFRSEAPDAVIAQGDTTTVMTAALSAFYLRIPFGHVEAGLRSGNLDSPFPEEMNRIVAGHLTRWHFAPTTAASANLRAEGIPEASILVTGNTVIDALLDVSKRCDAAVPRVPPGRRLILVTAHRRENFGEPMARVFRAIRHLAETRSDVHFIYPVHPNPNVRALAAEILSGHPAIELVEPLDYVAFVAAMSAAHIILSDSGGVQEEAPALAKPLLVLRHETERPEALAEGVVRLVGTDRDAIIAETTRLLDDAAAYRAMARGVSPYGDGQAARRIARHLAADLLASDRLPASSLA